MGLEKRIGIMNEKNDKKNRLKVYISSLCFACEGTGFIVKKIEKYFPDLKVEIIDIESENMEIPDSIFSVPTYSLNGKTVSLGNPGDDFFAKLRKILT